MADGRVWVGLKEQLKFRNRKAVEDRRELDAIDARWRRRWEKEEQVYISFALSLSLSFFLRFLYISLLQCP